MPPKVQVREDVWLRSNVAVQTELYVPGSKLVGCPQFWGFGETKLLEPTGTVTELGFALT
jgi:hypothetical protein